MLGGAVQWMKDILMGVSGFFFGFWFYFFGWTLMEGWRFLSEQGYARGEGEVYQGCYWVSLPLV
jgi:hypothetical protein